MTPLEILREIHQARNAIARAQCDRAHEIYPESKAPGTSAADRVFAARLRETQLLEELEQALAGLGTMWTDQEYQALKLVVEAKMDTIQQLEAKLADLPSCDCYEFEYSGTNGLIT